MSGRRMTAGDVTGLWAIMPTPSTPDASDWRAVDTVDLDETAKAVERLIAAGVQGILSMGTFGEAATLTEAEKRAFMGVLVETARGRVPVFVGTTTLNTRDTVTLTRTAYDLGADGTMLGLPMWCPPSVDVAVQFYRDVAEAVPGMNIAIYANEAAFKFDYPIPFWAQVSTIPQVVTAKTIGIAQLLRQIGAVGGRIKLMPSEGEYYAAARLHDGIDAFWSGGSTCDPIVPTTLRDLIVQARQSGDWSAASAFHGRLGASIAPMFPNGSLKTFLDHNIALEKARMNAAGWINAGPVRPPYHLAPPAYVEGAHEAGRRWAALAAELHAAAAPAPQLEPQG